MHYKLVMVLLLTSLCMACDKKINGIGPVVITQKEVEPFSKIKLETDGKVVVRQDAVQSVKIVAQQNIADAIYTVVQNNTLKIYTDKWLSTNEDVTFEIVVPRLEGITLSGSGNLISEGTIKTTELEIEISGSGSTNLDVVTNKLECDISGSGNVAIKGSSNRTEIEISGSGAYKGFECFTTDCKASISGSGIAELTVSGQLDAHISGSGVINYKGQPQKINKSVNGSGKVNALN